MLSRFRPLTRALIAAGSLSLVGAVTLAAPGLDSSALAQPAGPSGVAPPTKGPALHLRVRGGSELSASASTIEGGFTLRGELLDDAGVPIPSGSVTVQALDGDRAVKIATFEPCSGTGTKTGGAHTASPDEAVLEADEHGSFCVTGRAGTGKLKLKLRFKGGKLHEGAETEVTLDGEHDNLLHTVLRFEPPVEMVDLERPTLTVTAKLSVDRAEAARLRSGVTGAAHREGLELTLEDERGTAVATATTGGDGRARFEVKTESLAGPGPGELRVRFAGTALLAKGAASQPIVRRADARLALSHPIEKADPDDGATVDVEVTTVQGPVKGGVLEVRRATAGDGAEQARLSASDVLGAANVDDQGHARILAAVSGAGGSTVPLVVRYVPAAPWYRPGNELRADVELKSAGILRQILLGAAVLAAAAWIAKGWRRSPRPRILPSVDGPVLAPSGKAGVQVLAPSGATGFRGVVADAHDGTPIVGARLSVVAPSFQGDGVVQTAVTDDKGAFTLEGGAPRDARLVVEADFHGRHEQPLPPPSVLAVGLVARRRALLERLVRWAKMQGAPFDGTPEPTPGHVRRVAARASSVEIEQWAGAVERAAFGPDAIDAEAEREVQTAEPRPLR